MTEVVQDIDRPDVNGTPKMQAIRDQVAEAVQGICPAMNVTTNDNLGSSVLIRGAFNPRSEWSYGIFENGLYFVVWLWPEKGRRYYEEGMKVTLELSQGSYQNPVPKLRKYTGPVDKAIAKLKKWLEDNMAGLHK